jgi:flagellar motility protein MotE (MotC chaperone)
VKTSNPSRFLRLLPAVAALSLVVLVVKASGLARSAHAADAGSQIVMASAVPAPKAADPAADDTETSSSDVDVLTSLAHRRAELDKRQHELEMRQNLLEAAEKRVDDKIADLKSLQKQIQTLLGMRDDAEQKQLTSLVKTYSSMKPRDAGRIFNDLDEDVLLGVASQMKPDALAPILAQMQSEAAQKLTVRLAQRLKAPAAKAPLPAAVQPAAPPPASSLPPAAALPSLASASPAVPVPSASAPAPLPAPAAAPAATTAPVSPPSSPSVRALK